MYQSSKSRSRRAEIRRNRPDIGLFWQSLSTPTAVASLSIALVFWMTVSGLTMLRDRTVRYRPGQYVHHDVASRVAFNFRNFERENDLKREAREQAPRVYRRIDKGFAALQAELLALPAATGQARESPPELKLTPAQIAQLQSIAASSAKSDEYKAWVLGYADWLRAQADGGKLVVLPADERERNLQVAKREFICLQPPAPAASLLSVEVKSIFSTSPGQRPSTQLLTPEKSFANLTLAIAEFAARTLGATHELSPELTAEQQNQAAARIGPVLIPFVESTVLVPKDSTVTTDHWKLLAEEQRAYVSYMWEHKRAQWILGHIGVAGLALLLTAAMGLYIIAYQPRIVQNYVRGIGIATLLAAMLLVAELAGVGTVPLLIFGVAPTLLVAMILCIAYDQRFAIGIASLHGLLVTAALGQGINFYLIIWLGVLTCCFLLDDVRTRSKLVEVGGLTAVVMILVAAAAGAVEGDPLAVIGQNCLYVGAAAMGVGFIVLGILPFVEKTFKITTSMTLLEFADASQPLLKRLAVEAPGTYNHSLQVATLAEAAAEAINANSLLCRVGSYYHDIGKVNKADYFCENQLDGQNRHINLNPNVSLLIIIGHVKDGIELAREYHLPPLLLPIIQEHHGTTLVEYFYLRACKQSDSSGEDGVADVQYRYPGPKPRSRESAVVMMADIVESAARSMVEPTANRIETLVHELITRRLTDGQFEDCDLTFAELELVEKSLIKTLLGIYHGRLSYPSTSGTTSRPGPAVKSA